MKKNVLIGIAIAAGLIAIGLVIFDGSVINFWDGHFDIPVAISRGGQELGTNDISCVRYSANANINLDMFSHGVGSVKDLEIAEFNGTNFIARGRCGGQWSRLGLRDRKQGVQTILVRVEFKDGSGLTLECPTPYPRKCFINIDVDSRAEELGPPIVDWGYIHKACRGETVAPSEPDLIAVTNLILSRSSETNELIISAKQYQSGMIEIETEKAKSFPFRKGQRFYATKTNQNWRIIGSSFWSGTY